MYEWTLTQGRRAAFGAGKQNGSWTSVVLADGSEHSPLVLYSYARCEVKFHHLLAGRQRADAYDRDVDESALRRWGYPLGCRRPAVEGHVKWLAQVSSHRANQ
jgi:hypothetical protein